MSPAVIARRCALPLLAVLASSAGTASAATSQSPIPSAAVDGTVSAVAVDDAGRTYLGGAFSRVGQRTGHLAALSALTGGLQDVPEVDGNVYVQVPDGSGGYYIGGAFRSVDGVPRSGLARLLPDGSVDPVWNPIAPDAFPEVYALAVVSDGVLVGGLGLNSDFDRMGLMKVSATGAGAVDTSFTVASPNPVLALVQSGDTVYAAGEIREAGGGAVLGRGAVKFNAAGTGSVDTGFAAAVGAGDVTDLALAGSDLYVGGRFSAINSTPREGVAKVSAATGTVDAGWSANVGSQAPVHTLTVSGTDLYLGGNFTSVGGQARSRLARVSTADGTVSAWSPSADEPVTTIAVAGADVYVGGSFTSVGGANRSGLARLSSTTGAADGWNPRPDGQVESLVVAGATVYAGGTFNTFDSSPREGIARLNADGTLDPSWDPGTAGGVPSAFAVADGAVYVAGDFTSIGGGAREGLAKLSATTGALDAAWAPAPDGAVTDLAARPDGLFVAGAFTTIGGQPRPKLAKLDLAGTGRADTAFTPAPNGDVLALAADGAGVYAGGSFTQIGSASRRFLARLSSATGAADGWNPDPNGAVGVVATSRSDVYVTGVFSTVGGQSRPGLAKLSAATGALDGAWTPSRNGSVTSIGVAGNDVYFGGPFSTVNGQHRPGLAKVTGPGGTLDGWDPARDDTEAINSLAATGTRLAVGGRFTNLGGTAAWGIALFDIDDPYLRSTPNPVVMPDREVDDGPGAVTAATVTNAGTTALSLTGVTASGSDFALAPQPGDCENGTALAVDDTCTVHVRFDPSGRGIRRGAVSVASDAASDLTIALSGTGTQTELTSGATPPVTFVRDIDDGALAKEIPLTNTGTEPVTLTGATATGAGFAADPGNCTTIAINETCNLTVRFDPTAMGQVNGLLTVESNAPDVTVALAGSGTQTELTAAPAALDLGAQDVGAGATPAKAATLTNSGTEPVTVSGVVVSGSGFSAAGGTCVAGATLAANDACTIAASFDPSAEGATTGAIAVTSNAAAATVPLTGTGTATRAPSIAPTSVAFGSRDVAAGPTAPRTVTISNAGSGPFTVGLPSIAGTGAPHFKVVSTTCALLPLGPGGSCQVQVVFDPSATGPHSAALQLPYDYTSTPSSIALTGTGTAKAVPAKATIASTSLSLDKKSRIAVKVTCAGSQTCAGTLRVTTAKKVRASRKGKPKVVTVATQKVRLPAGKTSTVRLKPGAAARVLVRGLKRLGVVVTLSSPRASRKLTLTAPRGR